MDGENIFVGENIFDQAHIERSKIMNEGNTAQQPSGSEIDTLTNRLHNDASEIQERIQTLTTRIEPVLVEAAPDAPAGDEPSKMQMIETSLGKVLYDLAVKLEVSIKWLEDAERRLRL
jgi:hypothetical protein